MGRVLAIDYGKKRCGIAVSDPLRIIANPLDTVHADELLSVLQKYTTAEEVDVIVFGEPFRHDGSHAPLEEDIQVFIEKLKGALPKVEIARINEMYSSKDAMRALISSGVPKKKRRDKKLLDRTAATLLLQEYLNQ